MALYNNIFARIGDEFTDSTLSDSIKYLTDVSELLEINNFKYLDKYEGDVLKKAALKEELGINSRTSYIEGFYFEILEKHIIRFNEELNLIWNYKKAISEDFTDVDLFNLINKYNLSQIKQFINNNFKSEYNKIIIFDNLISNTINVEGIKHLFIIKVVKNLYKDCEEYIQSNATTVPYYNFEKLTNYEFIFADTIDTNKVAKLPSVTIGSQIFLDFDNVTFVGNITSLGNDPVKRYGFFWSLTNPQPYEGDNVVEFGDTNSILSFQKYIDSLPFGSTIYVRSFAENSYNITISDVTVFTTKTPVAPILNLGQTENDTSLTVQSVDANNPLAIKFNLYLSSIGDSKPNQILNDIQHIGFKYYSFENPDVVLDNLEINPQENTAKTVSTGNKKSSSFYAPALGKYYVEAYAENSYLRTTTPKLLFKLSIVPKVNLITPNLSLTTPVPLATDIVINYYNTNNNTIRYSLNPNVDLDNNNVVTYGSNMLTLEYSLTTGSPSYTNIPMSYSYNPSSLLMTGVTSDFLLFNRLFRVTAKNFIAGDSQGTTTTFNFQTPAFTNTTISYAPALTNSTSDSASDTERKLTYSYNNNLVFVRATGSNFLRLLVFKNNLDGTLTQCTLSGTPTITGSTLGGSLLYYDDTTNKLYVGYYTLSGTFTTYLDIFNVSYNSITNTVTFTDFSRNNKLYDGQVFGAFINCINIFKDSVNTLYLSRNTNGLDKLDVTNITGNNNDFRSTGSGSNKVTFISGASGNIINLIYNKKKNIFYFENGTFYYDLNDNTFKGTAFFSAIDLAFYIDKYNIISTYSGTSNNIFYNNVSFLTGSFVNTLLATINTLSPPSITPPNTATFTVGKGIYVNDYLIIIINPSSSGQFITTQKVILT